MPTNDFVSLQAAARTGGTEAVLDALAARLLAAGKYHELFEARKMQVRNRLGLPLAYHDEGDELAENLRNRLEEGLLGACREVGQLLLNRGAIREGWMYLRPVGDRTLAAQALANIPDDEENREALIEVCFHEGVDVGRGFQLVLDHFGTCNAITTYDSVMPNRSPADQRAAAKGLLRHLYRELTASVRADIARQQGSAPNESNLVKLLEGREWLTSGGSYHVDASHLNSVVRIARVLDDAESHRLAWELCQYGSTLSRELQYPGSEPFADIYEAHGLYYRALLNDERQAALDYFQHKAETLSPQEQGIAGVEAYVNLLARCGKAKEALHAALRLLPAGQKQLGEAPSLVELAERSGDFATLLDHCAKQEDLLGYGVVLAHQTSRKT